MDMTNSPVVTLVKEFIEISSIAGFSQMTHENYTGLMKSFWIFTMILMIGFSTIWSYQSYVDWRENPVQSVVKGLNFYCQS